MFMVNSSQGVPLNYSKLFDANSNVECYLFFNEESTSRMELTMK